MAHDGVFIKNTIRSVDISGHPSISKAMSTLFILASEICSGKPRTVVLFLTEVVSKELPLGDFTKHPRQLVLDELVGSDGVIELMRESA